MGLILSEPIKNVVRISKTLAKTSVEDAETHSKAQKQMQKEKEDGAVAGKRKSAKRQKEKEKPGRGQKHGKKNGVLAGGLCFFLPCTWLLDDVPEKSCFKVVDRGLQRHYQAMHICPKDTIYCLPAVLDDLKAANLQSTASLVPDVRIGYAHTQKWWWRNMPSELQGRLRVFIRVTDFSYANIYMHCVSACAGHRHLGIKLLPEKQQHRHIKRQLSTEMRLSPGGAY
jgi:hypothetical protein